MRHSSLFGTIADNHDKERHRIDVDCRRTDRTQPFFIASSPGPSTPDGISHPSQTTHRSTFSPANDEIGAQSQTNEHVEKLCEILLTYELYEKKLGEHRFCVLEASMNTRRGLSCSCSNSYHHIALAVILTWGETR